MACLCPGAISVNKSACFVLLDSLCFSSFYYPHCDNQRAEHKNRSEMHSNKTQQQNEKINKSYWIESQTEKWVLRADLENLQ